MSTMFRFLALSILLLSMISTEAFQSLPRSSLITSYRPTTLSLSPRLQHRQCSTTTTTTILSLSEMNQSGQELYATTLYASNSNTNHQQQQEEVQEKPFLEKIGSSFYAMLPTLLAAFCTAALMYPLDLVRALQMANAGSNLSTQQLLVNFYKAHGLVGFFLQGLAPELARSTWMRFVKFGLFPVVHQACFNKSEKQGNEVTKATAAIIASFPEAFSIMPLEIAKIALQLDTANEFKNNMFAAMAKVFAQQGLPGLLVGYWGIQYRQSAWSAGYFASIKFFEKKVKGLFSALQGEGPAGEKKEESKATKMLSQLLSGFLAGVFGACLNTPGDTIRSTLQKRVLTAMKVGGNPSSGGTLFSVGKEIVNKGGFGALYAGFTFKAFHLGGGGALMAFLIPFFTRLLNPEDKKKQ